MRPGIGERIEIPRGDPVSVVDALNSSGFTGLLSIREKKAKTLLLFLKGKVLRVLKEEGETSHEIPPEVFYPPHEGMMEVLGADHLAVTGASMKGSVEADGLFYIVGFGDRFEETRPLAETDLAGYIKRLKGIGFSGYALIHREIQPEAIILFMEGQVVRIYPKTFSPKDKKDLFISSAILEDTVIPLITSIDRAELIRAGSLQKGTKLSSLIAEEKKNKMNLLLEVRRGEERESYFIFHGVPAGAFRRTGPITESISREDPFVHGRFSLYRLNPPQILQEEESELLNGEEDTTGEEMLLGIKEALKDVAGGVWKVLWEKVLYEMEIEEDNISRRDIDKLVSRLAKEIPHRDMRFKFMERVRRVLG